MLTEEQAKEILRDLEGLPAEKIEEARNFIRFLQAQYGRERATDEASEWSDEDLSDFTAASSRHAERTIFRGE
ncbi:MAG TPA: hypothetical protein VEX60_17500 [Pyrinomonadaceae bacterium]|nr:hypothetical protein [Pyrinomonadaceae bacterium]